VSLRGPPCALDVLGIPYGEVRDSPFIIRISDNKMHKGKICKSYDTIASSEMLSIKITSDNIKDENWFLVYEEVIIEGFKRSHNYEITHVRKIESHNYASIVATSPE
jgi:hypothetical protein